MTSVFVSPAKSASGIWVVGSTVEGRIFQTHRTDNKTDIYRDEKASTFYHHLAGSMTYDEYIWADRVEHPEEYESDEISDEMDVED